jgi:hypothetical protein
MNIELDMTVVLGLLVTAVSVLAKFIIDKVLTELQKANESNEKLTQELIIIKQRLDLAELGIKRAEVRSARLINETALNIKEVLTLLVTRGDKNE